MTRCYNESSVHYITNDLEKRRRWYISNYKLYRKHDMPVSENFWLKTKHIQFKNNGGASLYLPFTIYHDEIEKDVIQNKNRDRGIVFRNLRTISLDKNGIMNLSNKN